MPLHYTTDLHGSRGPECTKTLQDGTKEVAALVAGDNGFLVAQFQNGMHQTELPNVMLEHIAAITEKGTKVKAQKKGRGKMVKKVKKKKKAPKFAASPAAPQTQTYGVMWYKNNGCIGIRQKFGLKQQVLSFGGKSHGLGKEVMKAIGSQVASKLAQPGESKASCRAFAEAKMQEAMNAA